jgi:hypothetical protein
MHLEAMVDAMLDAGPKLSHRDLLEEVVWVVEVELVRDQLGRVADRGLDRRVGNRLPWIVAHDDPTRG